MKCAHHKRGAVVDPASIDREPTRHDAQVIGSILEEFLPRAAGPIVSMRVCLYTNSPDLHFIIGRHPQRERVTIACGFSGHGFKFASVIGEVLGDLATTGSTRWPVQFLSPDRFARRSE
jgi:sarcosine oxidase